MIDAIVILCGQVMTVQREDVPTIATEKACAEGESANVRKILLVSFVHRHSLLRKKKKHPQVTWDSRVCPVQNLHVMEATIALDMANVDVEVYANVTQSIVVVTVPGL